MKLNNSSMCWIASVTIAISAHPRWEPLRSLKSIHFPRAH